MKNTRADFPALAKTINGKPQVYLDTAASSLCPTEVLQAVAGFYTTSGACPHQGLHTPGAKAALALQNARQTIADFTGVLNCEEIIFTKNATEALNLLAFCYAAVVLKPGDSIAVPITEHHANLVPWQRVAQTTGASLAYLYPDDSGNYTQAEIDAKITPGTKIVAFSQVSHVTGFALPVRDFIARAKKVGAATVLDCAQSAARLTIDLHALDVDFAVFSGHKMYAPEGTGFLYGRKDMLDSMPPFLAGSGAVDTVSPFKTSYMPAPLKFEAGGQNTGGAAGLAAAIRYLQKIGLEQVEQQEHTLIEHLLSGLSSLPFVQVLGAAQVHKQRHACVSFILEGILPQDAAAFLDAGNIAVSAGHQNAQPFMSHLGVSSCLRASVGVYTTKEDIDALLHGLLNVKKALS